MIQILYPVRPPNRPTSSQPVNFTSVVDWTGLALGGSIHGLSMFISRSDQDHHRSKNFLNKFH